MVPAANIKGWLVDETGRPITEQRLWIKGKQSWPSTSVLGGATTDAEGRFEITGVPVGYELWFEYGGLSTRPTTLSQPGINQIQLKCTENESDYGILFEGFF